MPRASHTAILELGISLDYFTEKENKGICQGICIAWISACMVHDEERFKKRIQYIVNETDNAILCEKINQAKEKIKRHQVLSEDELNLLELLAFYEQVLLFQVPQNHFNVFNAPYTQQNIMAISKIVASKSMADQGGLSSFYSYIGLYTQNEMVTYLDNLAKSIDSMSLQENTSLGCVLSSHDHTLGLIYIPAQQSWSLMDINQWPPREFVDTQQLAKKILADFAFPNTTPNYTALHLQLMSTIANIEIQKEPFQKLVKQLNTIKKDYPITAEILAKSGSDKLIYIAAEHGEAEVITKLGALNANLSQTIRNGATPAWVAAQNGHAHVIKKLGILKADLNQATDDGTTPAFITAQNGYAHVIRELGILKANLNQARNDGATPALIAAQEGHVHVIKELGAQKADLNQAMDDGTTPALIAAQEAHTQVIKELGILKADLNQAKKDGATPLFIAAQSGHIHIVRYLIHYPGIQQIPIMLSATSLRGFAQSLDLDIQQKIEEHIALKLSKGENEANISVSPKEIANIMGHAETVAVFNDVKQEIVQQFGIFKPALSAEGEQEMLVSLRKISEVKQNPIGV